jgi:hypothetical protein
MRYQIFALIALSLGKKIYGFHWIEAPVGQTPSLDTEGGETLSIPLPLKAVIQNFFFKRELGTTSYVLTGDPITFHTLPPHCISTSLGSVFVKNKSQW